MRSEVIVLALIFVSQLVKLLKSARDVAIDVPGERKENCGLSLAIQEHLLSK